MLSPPQDRYFTLACFLTLSTLFVFIRLFNISNSLLYFNDMGRDSLVLLEWAETGKPPLLGPQTSALPFNQSALYFYLLYPIFLLTHYSSFSAVLTNVGFYLVTFATALYISRKNKILTKVSLLVFFLLTIHPQFIIQNRFVWNPSFVGPSILLAFLFFYRLKEKFSFKYLAAFSLSIAAATAFSYSALPILLAFGVASIVYFRVRSFIIGATTAMALGIVNLPTIFFELRHGFVLTQMMLTREKLAQSGAGFSPQLRDLIRYSLSTSNGQLNIFVVFLFVTALIISYFIFRRQKESSAQESIFQVAFLVFSLAVVFTLVIPIGIHAHYIFGVVTLGFITLAVIPNRVLAPLLSLIVLVWLLPIAKGNYFLPVSRTVFQMESCFATICNQEKEALFVSVQSDFHPYHNAPEHRFLLRKAGCNVKNIEANPEAAQHMVVVLDSSLYEHGRTTYNELSMFGPAKELRKYTCLPNFGVVLLEKSLD